MSTRDQGTRPFMSTRLHTQRDSHMPIDDLESILLSFLYACVTIHLDPKTRKNDSTIGQMLFDPKLSDFLLAAVKSHLQLSLYIQGEDFLDLNDVVRNLFQACFVVARKSGDWLSNTVLAIERGKVRNPLTSQEQVNIALHPSVTNAGFMKDVEAHFEEEIAELMNLCGEALEKLELQIQRLP
jgi:hypothetical protein